MSHISYTNKLYHAVEWFMSHMWMGHITPMNISCFVQEWDMSHLWISNVTHVNGPYHTYGWAMSATRMTHITLTYESSHTCERVFHTKAHIISRVSLVCVTWRIHRMHTPFYNVKTMCVGIHTWWTHTSLNTVNSRVHWCTHPMNASCHAYKRALMSLIWIIQVYTHDQVMSYIWIDVSQNMTFLHKCGIRFISCVFNWATVYRPILICVFLPM